MEFKSSEISQKSGALIDKDCIVRAKEGDRKALNHIFQTYEPIVYIKSNKYFIPGGEIDDLAQEGFIGLHKAIVDYRFDRETSFKTFAELCINRSIINSIKAANRYKHAPLNKSKSLDYSYGDDDGKSLLDLIYESGEGYIEESNNPEKIFLKRERSRYLFELISSRLSRLELDVLSLYLVGSTYLEIAENLGRDKKSIDNALRRIKKKASRYLKLYY